jgi:hypothetical protein
MMVVHMLTTTDNPYNYFTEFEAWFAFDTWHGYNTLGYLARIIRTSDELSEADQNQDREDAINEILKENILGIYTKVADPNS